MRWVLLHHPPRRSADFVSSTPLHRRTLPPLPAPNPFPAPHSQHGAPTMYHRPQTCIANARPATFSRLPARHLLTSPNHITEPQFPSRLYPPRPTPTPNLRSMPAPHPARVTPRAPPLPKRAPSFSSSQLPHPSCRLSFPTPSPFPAPLPASGATRPTPPHPLLPPLITLLSAVSRPSGCVLISLAITWPSRPFGTRSTTTHLCDVSAAVFSELGPTSRDMVRVGTLLPAL